MDDTLSDNSSSARTVAAGIEAALYERAIRLLSRREHSRAELSHKLAAKTPVTRPRRKTRATKGNKAGKGAGYAYRTDEDTTGLSSVDCDNRGQEQVVESIDTSLLIEQVLDKLEQSDYLSDARFAELYAEQRYRKGYGERDIRAQLRAKGIERRLADQTMLQLTDETGVDWYSHAADVLTGRFGGRVSNEAGTEQLRARMIRFLQQRGFSNDQVFHALEQFAE